MPPINFSALAQTLQNGLYSPVADKYNPLGESINPQQGWEGGRAYGGTAGKLYRGVAGGTDRTKALEGSNMGVLGKGVYLTPSEKLAGTYGGGPKAKLSDGTRVVHSYDFADLPLDQKAYVHGGSGKGENVTIMDGFGDEIYRGPWHPENMESALQNAPNIKAVIGTNGSIGLNQVLIRDPSVLR